MSDTPQPNREAFPQAILAAPSWSVEYCGYSYDDARHVDGIWYFRDALAHDYRAFRVQADVLPLGQNSLL
jgi:hypothetical protein